MIIDGVKVSPTFQSRFWAKVRKTDGCWEWTAGTNGKGYGLIKARSYRPVMAHRAAFVLGGGEITEGLHVCHTCDNPKCVRPAHLFLGSRSDNMRDCATKGRIGNQNIGKTHCKRGHEFSGSNLITQPSGKRNCRTCMRMLWTRWDHSHRSPDFG